MRNCAENRKLCDIALTALKCCLWCGLMLVLDAMMIKLDRECPETIGGSVTVNQHRPEREKRGELCTVTGGKIYRCKVNRKT